MPSLRKELDRHVALDVAARFKLIPEFPHDRAVLEDTADWLQNRCHGYEFELGIWTPELQARWLQQTARDAMPRWAGIPALRALFESQFPTEPTEIARCRDCDGGGTRLRDGRYERCACRIGRMLHPSVVDEMNAPAYLETAPLFPELEAPPPPNAGTIAKVLAHPLTQEDIDREIAERKRIAREKQNQARKEGEDHDTE